MPPSSPCSTETRPFRTRTRSSMLLDRAAAPLRDAVVGDLESEAAAVAATVIVISLRSSAARPGQGLADDLVELDLGLLGQALAGAGRRRRRGFAASPRSARRAPARPPRSPGRGGRAARARRRGRGACGSCRARARARSDDLRGVLVAAVLDRGERGVVHERHPDIVESGPSCSQIESRRRSSCSAVIRLLGQTQPLRLALLRLARRAGRSRPRGRRSRRASSRARGPSGGTARAARARARRSARRGPTGTRIPPGDLVRARPRPRRRDDLGTCGRRRAVRASAHVRSRISPGSGRARTTTAIESTSDSRKLACAWQLVLGDRGGAAP